MELLSRVFYLFGMINIWIAAQFDKTTTRASLLEFVENLKSGKYDLPRR